MSGWVTNVMQAISGAEVKITGVGFREELTILTDIEGYYEFLGLNAGYYDMQVSCENYQESAETGILLTGSVEKSVVLFAELLPEVTNISCSLNGSDLLIEWSALESSVLMGYNVYVREYCTWQDNWTEDSDEVYPGYRDWELQNNEVVTALSLIVPVNEYNSSYQYWVSGVNIDGAETAWSEDTETGECWTESAAEQLYSFGLTGQTSPVEIPDNTHEIALHLRFMDVNWDQIRNYMTSWSVNVSEDEENWETVGSNNELGNLQEDHGITITCNMNAYKGRVVFLQTQPHYFNSPPVTLEIENILMEYSCDGSGFDINHAPELPDLPSPADESVDISLNLNISWYCSDIDGDDLEYYVFCGTDPTPDGGELLYSGWTEMEYPLEQLEYNTYYYWKIVADDGEFLRESEVWRFRTVEEVIINEPPEDPFAIYPQNNSTGVLLNSDLSWECDDPNGDNLTYNVYFGDNPDLGEGYLVAEGISEDSYDQGEMEYETSYYWQIAASDGEYESMGDVWTFSTEVYVEPLFEMVYVAAGDYLAGENTVPATISYNYEIMKYEVTNQEYVNYLVEELAVGGVRLGEDGLIYAWYYGDNYYPAGEYFVYVDMGDISWENDELFIQEGRENHPVQVNAIGADLFAVHYNMRLAHSNEWEKAARGMSGNIYSFSNELDPARANYMCDDNIWENTSPAGFYNGQIYQGFETIDSPSPYGCYDMCGNANEWTMDWTAIYRIVRGGAYWDEAEALELTSWYEDSYPALNFAGGAIRCCRTLR